MVKMNREELSKHIDIIDKDFYKQNIERYILYNSINKRKIISFIENKVRMCNERFDTLHKNEKENYTQILTDFTIKDICYQILSFIENGGKDE